MDRREEKSMAGTQDGIRMSDGEYSDVHSNRASQERAKHRHGHRQQQQQQQQSIRNQNGHHDQGTDRPTNMAVYTGVCTCVCG